MYRDMNDYEILYMVCDNNEDSFGILLKKYQPLIYKIVKEYLKFFKKFGYELDDLMQLGYITLYNTSLKYDIYNHSLFYSYFKKALNNMIISNIRCNKTNKKEILNEALSYDAFIPNSDIRYIDIIPGSDKRIVKESELVLFKNSMPAILSYIFELYYNGYNKEEISILLDEEVNIIKKNFNRIKQHALTYKSLFFE
jgi:RNA polymerase sporulation-specific sigma factor